MTNLLIFLLAFWNPWVVDAANEFNIHPQIPLGVMSIESGGDPDAHGASGERGLMQIMPDTALYIEAMTGMDADAILNDPRTNIRAGVWLLSLWYHRFDGDLDKALASYNAGAGEVIECGCVPEYLERYVEKARGVMNWNHSGDVCQGAICLTE